MDVLRWLYLVNAVLLISHEIDSAYWKEWELFKLRGGESGFVLLHVPLLFLVLYGLVALWSGSTTGCCFSLLLSLAGICAFAIHTFFMRRGHPEFRTPVSLFILTASLIVSSIQLLLTLSVFLK